MSHIPSSLHLITVLVKMKKILKVILFCILMLILLFNLSVLGEDGYFEKDGKLDFSRPDDIANALNNNKVSVERLFKEGNIQQIELVFGKVAKPMQSEILSTFSSSKVVVNGDISLFKDGKISTAITTNFDLNQYKNFDGAIAINKDGSVIITSNTNKPFSLDNNQILAQSSSSMKITGELGGRTITAVNLQEGQYVSLKNPQSEIKLFQGSVKTSGNQFILLENSAAEYSTTVIKTQNTKVDLGFNSGKNSYALFDKSKKEGFLFGRDYSVEFTKSSIYDKIGVDGNPIKIINSELAFTFDGEKIMLDSNFDKGVKNMIITNMQSGKKVGIALDGSFTSYSDTKIDRVGAFKRTIFFTHAYDAVLELDKNEVMKDFQILKGNLPPNPNEDRGFQFFVSENADPIKLEVFPKASWALGPEDVEKQIQKDIKSAGAAIDSALQRDVNNFRRFLIDLNNKKVIGAGSELIYGIENGKGFVEVYPSFKDPARKFELKFPNDRFIRNVILPNWITPKNNVKNMPAELLKELK